MRHSTASMFWASPCYMLHTRFFSHEILIFLFWFSQHNPVKSVFAFLSPCYRWGNKRLSTWQVTELQLKPTFSHFQAGLATILPCLSSSKGVGDSCSTMFWGDWFTFRALGLDVVPLGSPTVSHPKKRPAGIGDDVGQVGFDWTLGYVSGWQK